MAARIQDIRVKGLPKVSEHNALLPPPIAGSSCESASPAATQPFWKPAGARCTHVACPKSRAQGLAREGARGARTLPPIPVHSGQRRFRPPGSSGGCPMPARRLVGTTGGLSGHVRRESPPVSAVGVGPGGMASEECGRQLGNSIQRARTLGRTPPRDLSVNHRRFRLEPLARCCRQSFLLTASVARLHGQQPHLRNP